MVDVSGIPNMGFGGGGYFGGIPNQQPAMSAAQINASMGWNPNAVQFNPWANTPGGFGGQTAYYAGLGAAYGRQVAPSSAAAVAASNASRGLNPFATGAPAFQGYGLPGGGGAGSFSPSPNYPGAFPQYNAPRQYGWDTNEGAPAPAAPQVYNMGEFNPHTYGWDTNEGAPTPAQLEKPDWDTIWHRALPLYMPPTSPSSVTVPQQQSKGAIESYFERNPDVRDAALASGRGLIGFGADHVMAYGEDENRQLFNPIEYLNKYQDVKNAGMDAWQHYDKFGRNEGREATWGNIFNPETYLNTKGNEDIKAAGVDPRTHWLQYGQQEGRQGGGVDPWAGATRDAITRSLVTQQPQAKPPSSYFGGQMPNTFGAGLQQPTLSVPHGSIYQDPFGGYVPSTAPGPGGLPGNYLPRFDTQQVGFDPFQIPGGG